MQNVYRNKNSSFCHMQMRFESVCGTNTYKTTRSEIFYIEKDMTDIG